MLGFSLLFALGCIVFFVGLFGLQLDVGLILRRWFWFYGVCFLYRGFWLWIAVMVVLVAFYCL